MKKVFITLMSCISLVTISNGQFKSRAASFNLENNLAIQGYDPVAYFTTGVATKGNKSIQAAADGVFYLFSSFENKEIFLKDYKKYEPQYGGWCAYAMGTTGEKIEIDPATFKILNGKLYLFYHSWTNNTLTKWNKDETNLCNKANKNWSTIYH